MIKFIQISSKKKIGEQVAKIFIKQVKHKPKSVFLLATGSSPIYTYKSIIKDRVAHKTDWSKVKTFNLDEYLHLNKKWQDQSYLNFMNRNLFSGLNISKNATYFPTIQLLHGKYQRKINRCGGIDLAILGVGTNGHIAFNEPGTPINSLTHIVRIKKSTREANARFFDNNIDNVPTQAVTCGLKSILSSKKIVLIATGASKKDAIEHVKNAKVYDPNWPITCLINHKDVTIYIDRLN